MSTVKLENIRLKKIIEEKDDAILDFEKINESLQTNLKVEKKKNMKERQKTEKNLAEEHQSQEKVESDENTAILFDVPMSNKFAVLKTEESDSRNYSKTIEKSVSSQTEIIQRQIFNSFLPLEMSLSDHIGRNHMETIDSFTQVNPVLMISQFQQTTDKKPQIKSFEQYTCFYCKIPISSEAYLSNHVDKP
jgi:hypothetical protein